MKLLKNLNLKKWSVHPHINQSELSPKKTCMLLVHSSDNTVSFSASFLITWTLKCLEFPIWISQSEIYNARFVLKIRLLSALVHLQRLHHQNSFLLDLLRPACTGDVRQGTIKRLSKYAWVTVTSFKAGFEGRKVSTARCHSGIIWYFK